MNLKTLTSQQVENLADSGLIFQRGQAYLSAGAVTKFKLGPGAKSIQARVAGSDDIYQVEIADFNGEPEIECSCPYDGFICKHTVAVLLYFINERDALNSTLEVESQSGSESVLGQTLEAMDHSRLVGMLVQLSEQNDLFRRTLFENIDIPAQVVQQQPVNSVGVQRLKSEISKYFKNLSDTLSDYYESEELDEIDDFLDQIATFNPQDQLELFILLAEAGNSILDECGINAVQLGVALTLYGQAASLLTLSSQEKEGHFDRLLKTLETLEIWGYGAEPADLKAGLDALASTSADYTFLLERFKKLTGEFSYISDWVADYHLKLGDEANYLSVREANLTTEEQFLELADFWRDKSDNLKYVETLESWLARYIETKATRQASSFYSSFQPGNGAILDRLAAYYQEQHDDQNLLRILLAQAEHRWPTLDLYRRVREIGERQGQWPATREQFLSLIKPFNEKVLAEIHLYESNWQAAIDLARQQTGNGQEDIKNLVAGSVKLHQPEAAIELYRSLVDFNIERASRKYYQLAASYAARIKEVYLAILKNPAEWQKYISRIRIDNNRRKALLDEFKSL